MTTVACASARITKEPGAGKPHVRDCAHPITHISCSMNFPGEFDPGGEVHDTLKAEPKGLHARLAVGFAAQETAEAGDQGQHRVEAWGLFGQGLLGEDVSGLPLLGRQEQARLEVAGTHHQLTDVALAVRDIDQGGVGQLSGQLRYACLAFDPAHALLDTRARVPSGPLGARAHIHASSTPSGSRAGVTARVGCSYIPRCAS